MLDMRSSDGGRLGRKRCLQERSGKFGEILKGIDPRWKA